MKGCSYLSHPHHASSSVVKRQWVVYDFLLCQGSHVMGSSTEEQIPITIIFIIIEFIITLWLLNADMHCELKLKQLI